MSLKKLLARSKTTAPTTVTGYRGDPHRYSNRLSYEDLIEMESELGKTIFGPIPAGNQRKFFEYRKNIWIWHEKVMNPSGVVTDMTIRYEVRPDGVYKRPNNGQYRKIEGTELDNFRKAAKTYLNLIKTKLYS